MLKLNISTCKKLPVPGQDCASSLRVPRPNDPRSATVVFPTRRAVKGVRQGRLFSGRTRIPNADPARKRRRPGRAPSIGPIGP